MLEKVVGHYQIQSLLGQGASSQVYLAYDTRLQRRVAIKCFLSDRLESHGFSYARLCREIEISRSLDHPHIVTVFDFNLEHDPPFVVMELLKGGTLQDLRHTLFSSWQEAVNLLLQLCRALTYIHQKGLVHRDVKPGNLMFLDETATWLKLTDFGLARSSTHAPITETGTILGTVAYMSPEQARGEHVDARSDIYAFGILLFEAITGNNPQRRDSEWQMLATIISEEPLDYSRLNDNAPRELIDVIRRATARKRNERFQSTEELCQALSNCLPPTEAGEAHFPPLPAIAPVLVLSGDMTLQDTDQQILKRLFAGYERVAIRGKIGGGFSQGSVYIVEPAGSLKTIVKLAPAWLITQEWQAYHAHIQGKWPNAAPLQHKPVIVGARGGLHYPLLGGGGTFAVENLHTFMQRENTKTVVEVLRQQLFPIVDGAWRFLRRQAGFDLATSFDPLLPANLVIAPQPVPATITAHNITAATPPGAVPYTPGEYVRLGGFMVTRVDVESKTVTLDLPHYPYEQRHAFRVQITPITTLDAYQINYIVDNIEGQIVDTRLHYLRQEALKALHETGIQLANGHLQLPDGASLPDPLSTLPGLLRQFPNVNVGPVHFDLHAKNIIVETQTHVVNVIDFATAREDYLLHDLLRLETWVVTKLLAPALDRVQLPAQTICLIYRQLHCALSSAEPYFQKPRQPSLPLTQPWRWRQYLRQRRALRKPHAILLTIRQQAHKYLFDANHWTEYYQGLTLYLLGSLKFEELSDMPKQVAFLGAATAQELQQAQRSCSVPYWATRKFRLATRWLSIIILVSALILAVWPAQRQPAGVVATMLDFVPAVEVKRNGELLPAENGMRLAYRDIVSAYTGASANIYCHNDNWFQVPENSNLTLDCENTDDPKFRGPLPVALGAAVVQAGQVATVTLTAQEIRGSRASALDMPLLLTPRNSVITETQPALTWQPVANVTGYRVSVSPPEGRAWQRETAETTLLYPEDVPPLTADGKTIVTILTLPDEERFDRSFIEVLDEEELNRLSMDEATIFELGLSPVAARFLLAQLYQQRGLTAAAIHHLQAYTAQQKDVAAAVWQQLADLLFGAGLYLPAETQYGRALVAAQMAADLLAQANARVGLAQVALTLQETDAAINNLEVAENLYRQSGATDMATAVAAARMQLQPQQSGAPSP